MATEKKAPTVRTPAEAATDMLRLAFSTDDGVRALVRALRSLDVELNPDKVPLPEHPPAGYTRLRLVGLDEVVHVRSNSDGKLVTFDALHPEHDVPTDEAVRALQRQHRDADGTYHDTLEVVATGEEIAEPMAVREKTPTVRLRYIAPLAPRKVGRASDPITFHTGDVHEVPEDMARALLSQTWQLRGQGDHMPQFEVAAK